ncbi:MAG: hypothetical protein KGK30_10335, partial [Elusimicrobia bacterium]|nr:hypothetical protein [Elusimicrobiota bacterium]
MKSFNLAVAMAVGLAGRVCAQPHPYQAEISRLAQAGDVSTATVKARAERVDALVSAMAPKFPVVHPVLKEETSDLPAPAVHGEPASLAGFYLSPATMKDPRLAELKAVLADWNHRLQLKSLPQIYAALALFKAIYALPGDIRAVDPDTAKLLDARRQDMVRYQGLFARLAHPYLLALYNAAQHIGDRYNLYHPNNIDTFNCGTFTKTMSEAPTWLNTADGQYDQARADAAGLSFSRD